MKASGISLAGFVVMAYGYEAVQSWIAWQKYHAVDWADYSYYAVSALIALVPIIAFRRLSFLVVRPN